MVYAEASPLLVGRLKGWRVGLFAATVAAAVAASAAIALAAAAEADAAPVDCKVTIIGGGIGGAYTAWRLAVDAKVEAGRDVCLFEAKERFGGRILTVEGVPGFEDYAVVRGASCCLSLSFFFHLLASGVKERRREALRQGKKGKTLMARHLWCCMFLFGADVSHALANLLLFSATFVLARFFVSVAHRMLAHTATTACTIPICARSSRALWTSPSIAIRTRSTRTPTEQGAPASLATA